MTPEFGWLIEHNDYHAGHRWLRIIVQPNGTRVTTELDFTPYAVVALRFAREEDASAFIYMHPTECINCRPTAHQFGA